MSEQEFLEYLNIRTHLYLYGAGVVAKRVLRFCGANNISVEGFIVTEKAETDGDIEGLPIISIDEAKVIAEQIDVLISVKVNAYGGTCSWNDDLFDIPFHSRFILPPKTNEWLITWVEEYEIQQIKEKLLNCAIDIENENVEQNHLVVTDKDSNCFCRCEKGELSNKLEAFNSNCSRDILVSLYGEIKEVPFEGEICVENTDSYVVLCHLDKVDASDIAMEGYIPIQVGAALTDIRKGCQMDDTGDSISAKNRDYSECTAIYWIWKNTSSQDYVGINHYRRRLLIDQTGINYIKDNSIDVVLALPHFCAETVEEFFMRFVSKHDWQLMKEKVGLLYPEYAALWEIYENTHFYFHGNLALWKREWFDKYCEFAFSITEQIEAEYDRRGIIRQDRYMGFLFENLTSFFIMAHKDEMKIACTQMKWIGF